MLFMQGGVKIDSAHEVISLPSPYSYLSAIIGSTRVALRAGM